MNSGFSGVAEQFEELRTRLAELAGDHPVLAEMLAALQEAVARDAGIMRAILEQLPVGVTMIDTSYRVTMFNRRAREITGRMVETATPLIEWPVDLFHLDGSPMAFEERPSVRALQGEVTRDVLYEAHDPDRAPYMVDASATPIRDRSGQVILAVTVFEDVTERRLRDTADRDFIANAAHQLRTPIAAISSAYGALNAGAKNEPAVRDRFLDHIDRDASRMQRVTEALLALARAQRGDTPPVLSVVALQPLLERLVALSAPKKGVEVELSCPSQLAAITNEELVSEALANVLTNAIQHTASGVVDVRCDRQDGQASIAITDGGPGIAPEDRARVFERFFRGSLETGPGVGLGLAIAAAATQAAGGLLELVDSPGGASFRFTFERAMLGG
jgi:two-component system, OmpR family, phosphate regulon sensor histidine kinase PhoR